MIIKSKKGLKMQNTIQKTPKKSSQSKEKRAVPSFKQVFEKLKQNLAKPENKAVFERLKDKWDI